MLLGFLLLSFIVFLILNALKHKEYTTTINGKPLKIKVGDIFEEDGLKLIPFNDRFDTKVDDIIIAHTSACARGHSVDYRSYIKYECDKAIEAGIKIIVLYNSTKIDKSKCPEVLKNVGTHAARVYYKDGKYYWDYQSVKKAFDA